MLEDMPEVDCVLLNVDGKEKQIKVDLNPQANQVVKILGGEAAFVGMFRVIDVIIMNLRNPSKKEKKNKYKLPAPFDKEEVFGKMLLVRTPESSKFEQNF